MLSWSINLFRICGIRLEMHFSFLLLLAYFGWLGWQVDGLAGLGAGLATLGLVFGCVILHELGHSLTARRFGIHVRRILLLPFGGMAQFDELPREPSKELAITAAGPAVNFLLVALIWPFTGMPDLERFAGLPQTPMDFLHVLLLVNLVMGIFNLLPIFPMDGGRIFRALLALKLSYLDATRWAAHLSRPLAIAGIAFALYHQAFLPALLFAFIFLGGDLEYRFVRRREALRGFYVGDFVQRSFRALNPGSSIADAWKAFSGIPDPELVVVDDGRVVALLHRDILRRHSPPGTDLGQAILPLAHQRFTSLQAEWPLDPFYATIVNSGQNIFPVYSLHRLVGILSARGLDESVEWQRHRRRLFRQPDRHPGFPPPLNPPAAPAEPRAPD
ncbi:MAG: hypothetical protein EA425_06285 [Puniceicoccaceae bacterium]|nr:MAG: hypothetical protein EA425_06285 [Puniceicoccaceae bacterium]